MLNPFYGETYIRGPVSSASTTRSKKTTCAEDKKHASVLRNSQYSSNFGYGFRANCRTYSQAIFDDAPGTEMKKKCTQYNTVRRWVAFPPPSSGGTFITETICIKWEWVVP